MVSARVPSHFSWSLHSLDEVIQGDSGGEVDGLCYCDMKIFLILNSYLGRDI